MIKFKKFIVLLIVLLNLSCVSFARAVKVEYLIPEGFTGGVILVFNQPDGITPETGKDGMMKDQFSNVELIISRLNQCFDNQLINISSFGINAGNPFRRGR